MAVAPRVVAAIVAKVEVVGARALAFLAEIGQARKPAYRLVAIEAMHLPETRAVE